MIKRQAFWHPPDHSLAYLNNIRKYEKLSNNKKKDVESNGSRKKLRVNRSTGALIKKSSVSDLKFPEFKFKKATNQVHRA